MEEEGIVQVSSTELGRRTGQPSHTIRKDINYLGEIGNTGLGYDISRLKNHLIAHLGVKRERKACIVGLGRLGSAILASLSLAGEEFHIVAGFDSDVNKIETIKTAIMVFPSYDISEVVKKMGIELAIIAVPAGRTQEVADRLITGGIRGILNLTPTVITVRSNDCVVRNVDISGELRILSAMIVNKNSL
jgi:redox-sensing transcriptional repressor